MSGFWYTIYDFLILPLLYIFFSFASLFNKKIQQGLRERRKLFENLIIDLHGLDRRKKMIWFHSSSMGEFEQAKPIIEEIRKRRDVNIVVTFFSPSGYSNSKNYPHADIVTYLPFDSPFNAKRFVSLLHPELAIFMRYDIWPNIIRQLEMQNVPVFLVDATLNENSKRKLPVSASFHKTMYSRITKILTVSDEDRKSFLDLDVQENRLEAVGDTRFDRVYSKSLSAKNRKLLDKNIFEGKTVLVAGSTWEADENVLLPAVRKVMEYDKNLVLILVPHEPTEIHLEKTEHTFAGHYDTIRFSYLGANYNNERIIIVDSIGILLTLYYYADMAYVGGSFKQGIHNVLEPAVYGIPVIYGPKIGNSQEAVYMSGTGAGTVVGNKKKAYRVIRKLSSDAALRKERGDIAFDYIKSNIGATEKIIENIYRYI